MFDETPTSPGSPFQPPQPSYGQPPAPMSDTAAPEVSPPNTAETPAASSGGDQAGKHIHTMPGKFLQSQVKKPGKGSRRLTMLILVLVLVLLGGGGVLAYQYFLAGNTNTVTNQPIVNHVTNTNTNQNTNIANANTNTSNANAALPTIVKGNLTDPETNEKISTATLTIPSGALPASVTTVAITTLSAKLGAYANSQKYQAVGAVFILTPSQTKLTKDAGLEISYVDSELLDLGYAVKVDDLTIASWSQNEWVPLNSVVDTKNKIVSTKIDQFFTDGIALVVPKPVSSNTNTNSSSNTNSGTVVPSLDSDADGLTNQEEILYGTNAGSADTDLDGFKDGQEVLALYNPNGPGRLVSSSLIKVYENTTYRYSLYTPPSWTVGTLNADKLVTFTSITGEFVQVSIQENTNSLSAREWYLSLNPSVNQSQLRDIAAGSLTGILGPDGLNVFLADANYIYQITYNIGLKTEANYLTTFTMMYSSLQTSITSSGTNTNSNTNTPTNSNTNGSSNTNGGY